MTGIAGTTELVGSTLAAGAASGAETGATIATAVGGPSAASGGAAVGSGAGTIAATPVAETAVSTGLPAEAAAAAAETEAIPAAANAVLGNAEGFAGMSSLEGMTAGVPTITPGAEMGATLGTGPGMSLAQTPSLASQLGNMALKAIDVGGKLKSAYGLANQARGMIEGPPSPPPIVPPIRPRPIRQGSSLPPMALPPPVGVPFRPLRRF